MKKVIYKLVLMSVVFSLSSCLKSGLEDLPEYKDANITTISGAFHRYYSDEIEPSTGEARIKDASLTVNDFRISNEDCTVKTKLTLPSDFPTSENDKVVLNKVVLVVGLSSAARISPINDAPHLGKPGDWSKENQYEVIAANGTKKIWTIHVESLTK